MHRHRHRHIHKHFYIYIYTCVCVRACISFFVDEQGMTKALTDEAERRVGYIDEAGSQPPVRCVEVSIDLGIYVPHTVIV